MVQDVEQLHPYVGYSYRPTFGSGPSAVNSLGFRGELPSRDTNAVNVLILGGSVASALAQTSEVSLRMDLAALWGVAPERIHVINGALGGFREPQQVFALLYFYVLGYDFQSVILLDGFNEVALYPSEDAWLSTHPCLPRNWAGRVHASLLGRIARKLDAWTGETERAGICRFCARVQRNLLQRSAKWLRAINYRYLLKTKFLSTLPAAHFSSRQDLFAELAAQWARCSRLIADLCDARQVSFTHCLQPNQYLRSPDHAVPSFAYQPDSPYRNGVLEGYPCLRREGDALRRSGINFHDLSGLLDEVPILEAYVDACCHLSEASNASLARCIARVLPKPRSLD